MPPSLDPLTMQRLAYVRYLYREGIEESRRPTPLRSRAITSFHDAVENFIGLVAQHLGVELKKNTEFLGYWEAVKPFELPKKEQMRRLNDVRVALKHNGTFPSEHQIEQAREALADFFTTVTPKVFHVDFDAVDMVDLLTQPETARLVREAQTHADAGDYPMAMAGLVLAFDALLDHYATGDRPTDGESPFRFGARLYRSDVVQIPGAENIQTNMKLKKLGRFAMDAQDALRVISLGIDYPSLARFRVMSPPVYGYADGSQRFVDLPSVRALSADDYDWARHFIIESGLQASRADEIRGMQERAHELNWNPKKPFGERSWRGPVEPAAHEEVSLFEDETLDQ